MLICTLFIFREGENPKTYDHVLALEKIKDWIDSGLAVGFFLRFADNIAIGYNAQYIANFQALRELPTNPATERKRTETVNGLLAADE